MKPPHLKPQPIKPRGMKPRSMTPRSMTPRGMPQLAWLSFPASLALWEAIVRLAAIPAYILPGPLAILQALFEDGASLLRALATTLSITLAALLIATLTGTALASLVAANRLARQLISPWAVILQVTPIVAIAPLIIVWTGNPATALILCASIVAFFPIYSATLSGLSNPPPDLLALFQLHHAKRWQEILWLRLPAALPHFLSGLRIAGGLSLVGAVVAEFVAGTGGTSAGLASRILESSYRLEIPRMFACLTLLAATGFAINQLLSRLEHTLLKRQA